MLVTGINSASGAMGSSLIEQNLKDVHVEFTITTPEENRTLVLNNLNELEDELEGFEGVFASYYSPNYETTIQKGEGAINWSIFNTTEFVTPPLSIVVSREEVSEDLVKYLLSLGLDPYVEDDQGKNAFDYVKSSKIEKILLEHQ